MRRATLAIVCLLTLSPCMARAAKPKDWAQENLAALVNLYRHFHRNPELSYQEKETSKRLAAELRKTGAEVFENVGGYGVVALIKNGPGPTVMLRTDLDALPVAEQTGLPYASQAQAKDDHGATVAVMHACGHDVHMTCLLGVARYMAAHKDLWSGTLMLIGQPAEELGAGAEAMLQDGLFRRFPRPDFALAQHVDSTLATGRLAYRPGYALANVDSVDVLIHGRGGHGAYPHATIDPVVIAARLVLDLQTIVSREVKPTEPAVVTVGSIHAGTKHNVIGDDCRLQLTVRSYTDEVRQQLLDAIRRKAKAAAASAGAPDPEIVVSEGTPSLYNDDALAERLAPVFKQLVGEENVLLAEPAMGGEDFSRYGKVGVPILMYRLGAVSPKRLEGYAKARKLPPSLHSGLFYPDAEETLVAGVASMAEAALALLKPAQ